MELGEVGVAPLLNTIVEQIPPPTASIQEPFAMLVSMIEWDQFVGAIVTGKVMSGVAEVGSQLHVLSMDGKKRAEASKVSKIYMRCGIARREVQRAVAGQIVSIAGINAGVTDTVSDPECFTAVATSPIDPPTLKMSLGVNTGPLVGKEGSIVNPTQLHARLQLEVKTNVALNVEFEGANSESFEIHGRGEMHLVDCLRLALAFVIGEEMHLVDCVWLTLIIYRIIDILKGVLIETMRREGFELSVSPPRVVYRMSDDGKRLEPIEEVMLEVDNNDVGTIVEAMNARKGEMLGMAPSDHSASRTCLSYTVRWG